MTLIEIQRDVIQRFNVDLCDGSKCDDDWSRMHAHVKQRRVCKWKPKASIRATFDLLHEIGHIETTTGKMRRCEEEYYATAWAIDMMREYGISGKISDNIKELYQWYIFNELERGMRRGGSGYPTREQLTLKW